MEVDVPHALSSMSHAIHFDSFSVQEKEPYETGLGMDQT